ncbi:MAG TPA: copper chaperone PCu(A)C [Aliiroseovarius sp.]|nr:copper chaperone PCu(A)C [Aliiroseovarius sp.]
MRLAFPRLLVAPVLFALALILVLTTDPARAGEAITVEDGYAISAGEMAVAGAAYFTLRNSGSVDDRLIAVASDAARRVMLHASVAEGDVMRMVSRDEGLVLPAGETIVLEPGGNHIMLMGLTAPLAPGDTIKVALTFAQAGERVVEVAIVGPNAVVGQ